MATATEHDDGRDGTVRGTESCIASGMLYTCERARELLGVDVKRWQGWMAAGLVTIELPHTRRHYVLGDDIIAFFRRFRRAESQAHQEVGTGVFRMPLDRRSDG